MDYFTLTSGPQSSVTGYPVEDGCQKKTVQNNLVSVR